MPAASTDKLKKLARRWVGQIGAGGVADASTATIPLASVTNLPTDTAVVATIDRVDVNGVATPNLEETVIGVVSGTNLATSTRGVEGTAQAHNAGAVVEILVTAKGYNDIIDAFLVGHTQSGAHASSLALTSPVLTTPLLGTPTSGVMTNVTGVASGLTAGVSNALKSATTTVDVSAATAPSSGQVLTATAGTTATWQTPASGSVSVKSGTFTRDISTASGTQDVTGLGFTPKQVTFTAIVDGAAKICWGTDDGTNRKAITQSGTNWTNWTDKSIVIYDNAGTNYYHGIISAFASGQFTITWTKVGTPTGTATVNYSAVG